MTNTQKINAEAKSAYESGNYPAAFAKLWETGADNFISFVLKGGKSNWFIHPSSAEYFWNTFLLDQNIFDQIFLSDSAELMLHDYFSVSKQIFPNFEQKLASSYPELFIKSIRVNQVFLKEERIEVLCKIELDTKFQLHQKVWRKLYETEKYHWDAIERTGSELEGCSICEILSDCIIWLETNRFIDEYQKKLYSSAQVYSFFIEWLYYRFPDKRNKITHIDDFHKCFISKFENSLKAGCHIDKSKVSLLLLKISDYLNFRDCIYNPYSFDLNIQPAQVNKEIYFKSTPEAYYQWLVNGVRYKLMEYNYLIQGVFLVQELEKDKRVHFAGKSEKEVQMNRSLAYSKWATLILLSQLGNRELSIKNKIVGSEKILSPLITYSNNRRNRYEIPLNKHKQNSKNWHLAYLKVWKEAIDTNISREPYIIMTETDYIELNVKGLPNNDEDFTKEVVQLFCYTPNKKKTFDRFNPKYDVWQTPFFKMGNHLFCPTMFFANNNWFYSFVQTALTYKKQPDRNETRLMEENLAKIIESKGWKVKLISDHEASIMEGDVDIFIEDENTQLFLQLKRSYFRLDLKDAYNEALLTTQKAAKQLNEAEVFLSKENNIYNLRMKPIKWIVSTSCEGTGEIINECRKVNFFELIQALQEPSIMSVSDLLKIIESDTIIKDINTTRLKEEIPNKIKIDYEEIFHPLEELIAPQYQQLVFSDNEEETQRLAYLYNTALLFEKSGKKNDALVLLNEYLSNRPEDGNAYAAQANILSDMRLFDQSYLAYEKALSILPNDPFITRNYIVTLFESRQFYRGLILAFTLYKKFPLLGDLRGLFYDNVELCIKEGLLANEQIIELKNLTDKDY